MRLKINISITNIATYNAKFLIYIQISTSSFTIYSNKISISCGYVKNQKIEGAKVIVITMKYLQTIITNT